VEHESDLDALAHGLSELGLDPHGGSGLATPLIRLAELVCEWRDSINLTAHGTVRGVIEHLVLDALALDQVLPVTPALLDLGSGAGFPGLPLAIAHPDRRYTLLEAREKPHHFHREVIRRLGLQNVVALRGRAESLVPEPHPAVVAQAVAPPPELPRLLLRWTAPGGYIAIPYSLEVPRIPSIPGLQPLEPLHYRVPLRGVERAVWIARMVA